MKVQWNKSAYDTWTAIINGHKATVQDLGWCRARRFNVFYVEVAGKRTRVATLAEAQTVAATWATEGVL